MESGPCSTTHGPVHFPKKLAVHLQEVAGPEEIWLLRGQIPLLLELLGGLGLFTEGSEGRGSAVSFSPMPRAARLGDILGKTLWEAMQETASFLMSLPATR